jgi:acyl-CoA reductase-like NAD-dependent aldehyde dehydrogenase
LIQPISAIIDGQTITTAAGAPFAVIDPATEETIVTIAEADDALVDRAVSAARHAFEHGPWRQTEVEARQVMLRACADLIDASTDVLAALETANTGIPFAQIRDRQVARASYNFRFFADYIGQATAELYEQDPNYLTFVRREPVGVAALIAPWNAPIALGSMKIAGAIAFGNSCVIKPSEQAPLGVNRLVELLQEILPPGVVNLVNGRGATTGDRLVRHDEVNLVSFTGGTATGRAIMAAAGQGLKPSTVELGGKSANIIFDSADFDQALDAALLSIFTTNGQQCLAGSRILVQRGIADRFIAAFVARARALKIGHPLEPDTELGPLASRQHLDHVLSFVPEPGRDDVRLLTGGRRAAGFDRGNYIEPTAVLVERIEDRICQDEIFGPFAAFMVFDTAEEAYQLANGTRFGLVSYVWSQDMATIMEAQDRLSSGIVWCNTPMTRELRAPFGGYGDSGVGAEGGRACEAFYTRQKTVSIPRRPLKLRKLGAL